MDGGWRIRVGILSRVHTGTKSAQYTGLSDEQIIYLFFIHLFFHYYYSFFHYYYFLLFFGG